MAPKKHRQYRSADVSRVVFVAVLVLAVCAGCSKHPKSSERTTAFTGNRQFGAPPPGGTEAVDIYSLYHLPKLGDAPYSPISRSIVHLALVDRARNMGLISRSALRAWESASSLAHLAEETEVTPSGEAEFRGGKASELNRLLSSGSAKALRVVSASISVDEPISITRPGTRLDLGVVTIRAAASLPYLIQIEDTNGVDIRGGVFAGGDSAFLVNNSQRVRIANATIRNLGGAGIVVSGSQSVVVRENRISGLKYAGIILHRGVTGSVVEENRIENNIGTPNLASAVLLTDREVDITANPRALFGPDSYGALPQPVKLRSHPPSGNVIRNNQILHNQAAGIWSDGGVKNIITSNLIAGNAKEGVALASASIANVVAGNTIQRNGDRWGEPDQVLKMENVAASGRLEDGTPVEKLPGISLDNAMYNIVFENNVTENFGGGIKLVRTGLFNVIGMNTFRSNAQGSSDDTSYYGVELGAAPADATAHDPDVTASRGNIVFSNLIRGPHDSGIFFAKGSDGNQVFDNVIMEAGTWALESVEPMDNVTINNLTNMPSRNVGAGIDPNIFVAGRAEMDATAPETN